ncbi:Holliday junction resolvase RuvX [soil metagenome]
MRVLALDLGSRRIGVAVSDSEGRVATPIEVVERPRHTSQLHCQIAGLVADWEVELVLVGLPVDLEGRLGPAATGVLAEREELAAALSVPVEVHDERLTTRIAERALREQGGLDGRARRKVLDMVAAAVILQDWLDRSTADAPSEEDPTL